jgi:glucosylceramidase
MTDSINTSEAPKALAWLTSPSEGVLFQKQTLAFSENPVDSSPCIEIDAAQRFQTMDGFGFALTGGSASLISQLPPDIKQALLQELFSPDGIGVSCLRLTVGASDLSERSFSYADKPFGETDLALADFDIYAGDVEVIPLAKEILAINPALKLLASPWSAPAWMKTNGAWIGGALNPEYYLVYAQYWVKYLLTLRQEGINITAITVQNEPLNDVNEPSMLMAADEQALFIREYLGPALQASGLAEVEIFCWDHNCDHPEYPLAVLATAGAYVAGTAWHLYEGDISALSQIHAAHPDKKTYFTEQWVGRNGEFAGDLQWHVRNVVVGSCRHWSRLVLQWNLASDPDCRPHTPAGGADCKGALTIGDRVERNVAYYIIAHIAKFVRPGSVRILTNVPDELPNVAFQTPDNKLVLLVLNDSDKAQPFTVHYKGQIASAVLSAGAVGTYILT